MLYAYAVARIRKSVALTTGRKTGACQTRDMLQEVPVNSDSCSARLGRLEPTWRSNVVAERYRIAAVL